MLNKKATKITGWPLLKSRRGQEVTVGQASRILNMSASRVREMAADGRFHGATRHGMDWWIPRESLWASIKRAS